MKTLLFATTLLLGCHAALAGDPKAAPASPAAPAPAAAAPYSATHKSIFAVAADEHNPFWPIGWTKSENISGSEAVNPLVPHSSDFSVSTIMLNDPPMAVINGQEMAEGEVAAIPVNGQPIVVQLMAVLDGRVVLRWQNQNLVIPLHRQEDFSASVTGAPTPDTALR